MHISCILSQIWFRAVTVCGPASVECADSHTPRAGPSSAHLLSIAVITGGATSPGADGCSMPVRNHLTSGFDLAFSVCHLPVLLLDWIAQYITWLFHYLHRTSCSRTATLPSRAPTVPLYPSHGPDSGFLVSFPPRVFSSSFCSLGFPGRLSLL